MEEEEEEKVEGVDEIEYCYDESYDNINLINMSRLVPLSLALLWIGAARGVHERPSSSSTSHGLGP